jgi:hypothetical protein
MPAEKPRPTLADYVTIVVSPALIMAMIVSLVFFLVAILYRGEFAARLHNILFFFIFGIVLVARIAMAGLSDRATLYGGVLAVLAWLGMGNFVNYPAEVAAASWLINAGLVGLAWWLSHQLTHSCTYIDEKADSTGTGVLQAAGLEESASAANAPPADAKCDQKRDPKVTWWQRYQRFRAERQKKQPPGVWVVYFALAALPIFGLGQALIGVADVERRTYSFWLMTLYMASSLGLLVTTAFLGLRRYLRQRRLEMPKTVTAAWLVLGAVLLAGFVGIGAALPRPQAEFSLAFARAGSKDLAASNSAITQGEPGKGQGRPGAQEHDPKADRAANKNQGRDGEGNKGQAKGQGSGAKGPEKDGTKDSSNSGDKSAAKDRGKDAASEPTSKQDSERQGDPSPDAATSKSADNPVSGSWLKSLQELLTSLLKWIVFGILIVVTIAFVLTGGLRYLANFCDWARRLLEALQRFWEGLFAWRVGGAARADSDVEPPRATGVPFHAFANPFHSGRADKMSPADLVRYSFEALEAWAGEHDCGRGTDETPIEFTERLAEQVGFLDRETSHLGVLYAGVLYAKGAVPPDWRDRLHEYWQRLAAAPVRTTAQT